MHDSFAGLAKVVSGALAGRASRSSSLYTSKCTSCEQSLVGELVVLLWVSQRPYKCQVVRRCSGCSAKASANVYRIRSCAKLKGTTSMYSQY
eukprot:2779316-Pleurochrysis_carterae.AAC.1